MPVKRRCDADLDTGMDAREVFDDPGQVSLQVQPQGQKVRNNQDPGHAFAVQPRNGFIQGGRIWLQEGNAGHVEAAVPRRIPGNGAYRLIGGFDRRAVGEDDDSGFHDPWIYALM